VMTEDAAELDALRSSIRRVLTERVSREHLQRYVKSTELYDQALWSEAAELGWLALSVPESDGGLGLGMSGAAILYEELGRSLAPVPILGTLLVADAVVAAGTRAQKERWLPDLISGAAVASLQVVGPKPKASTVRLRRRSDGALVLAGDAQDLLDGAAASVLLITAKGEDGAPHLVWVSPREDGVTVNAESLVDRTRHLAHARFNEVVLAADRQLGEAPARAGLPDQLLGHAALALACDGLGLAEAVLTLTVEYLKTRMQFGKPIGSFQALKHRCANHKVALEATRAVTYDAVRHWAESRGDARARASLAKAHVCDMAAAVATDAVQLHGGIGFTWEHVCHLFLKRAKLNEALFGTRAAHDDHAADLLLDPGAAA
jgi:alkylation response protein AidB-like acyl-CoA dehydrogenase